MRRAIAFSMLVALAVSTVACKSNYLENSKGNEERVAMKLRLEAEGEVLIANVEDNDSALAFLSLLEAGSITVNMSDYASMEKVGSLSTTLPRNDSYINVFPGDIILYQGNQITIYYDTNSWLLTRLGHIEGATRDKLISILGGGDASVTFSAFEE